MSEGSPTTDEDEFVGPITVTLFSFGGQCCDDALDIGIVGEGHHLGVGHGEAVNNLYPSWKLARGRLPPPWRPVLGQAIVWPGGDS